MLHAAVTATAMSKQMKMENKDDIIGKNDCFGGVFLSMYVKKQHIRSSFLGVFFWKAQVIPKFGQNKYHI